MPPRPSQIAAELAERGYEYVTGQRARDLGLPARSALDLATGEVLSRRQVESIRGMPLPTVQLDKQDQRNLSAFIRTRSRAGETLTRRQAATDPRFLASRQTLRADRRRAGHVGGRGGGGGGRGGGGGEVASNARSIRDALAAVFGEETVDEWESYVESPS